MTWSNRAHKVFTLISSGAVLLALAYIAVFTNMLHGYAELGAAALCAMFLIYLIVAVSFFYVEQPDFVLQTYGLRVFEVPEAQQPHVRSLLEHMMSSYVPSLLRAIHDSMPEDSPERQLRAEQLEQLFHRVSLIWVPPLPIVCVDSARVRLDFYKTNKIALSFRPDALCHAVYHELHHAVDYFLLHVYDWQHERVMWWAIVDELRDEYTDGYIAEVDKTWH